MLFVSFFIVTTSTLAVADVLAIIKNKQQTGYQADGFDHNVCSLIAVNNSAWVTNSPSNPAYICL